MEKNETTLEFLRRISAEEKSKFQLGAEQKKQLDELIENWNLNEHKEGLYGRYIEV